MHFLGESHGEGIKVENQTQIQDRIEDKVRLQGESPDDEACVGAAIAGAIEAARRSTT
jgi:hypothetical protein